MATRLKLADYIDRESKEKWIWGEKDCCTFPSDWWMVCGLPDPMDKWRGAYSNEAECAEILGEWGGLLPLWVDALGSPESEARVGAIAVLSVWGQEAGGIFDGERWIIRAEKGWVSVRMSLEHISGIWNLG